MFQRIAEAKESKRRSKVVVMSKEEGWQPRTPIWKQIQNAGGEYLKKLDINVVVPTVVLEIIVIRLL